LVKVQNANTAAPAGSPRFMGWCIDKEDLCVAKLCASTVARWERGETEPQAAYRPRIAKALKVSVEAAGELLTGSGARTVASA
jgi:hypothetical protein